MLSLLNICYRHDKTEQKGYIYGKLVLIMKYKEIKTKTKNEI